MSGRSLRAASFALSFFAIPLFPAFIALTNAPVPGVAVLPRGVTLVLFALAVALALAWAAVLLAAPARPMPTLAALATFPAAAALAALLGLDPRAGAVFIAILGFGVVWHAVIVRFAGDAPTIRLVVAAFLVSGALASVLAIAFVLARAPAQLYTIGHGRAIGTFVLPGELAGYLIVYVPVALAATRSPLGLRTLATAGVVAGSVAFALTYSRAGWIGMAGAIAALVLLHRRGRGARYAAAIVGVAIVTVAIVFNSHHDPSENFTRLSIWQAALHIVAAFPLTGVGPFDFPLAYRLLREPGGEPLAFHAHSVALTVAAETGLVGLAALAWRWARFARELYVRLAAPSPTAGIALAVAAGLIGTWVQGLIDTVSVVIFGMWLPFMAVALVSAGEARVAAAARGARTSGTHAVRRAAVLGAAAAVVLVCAAVQTASSALARWAAAPYSLPAHLPARAGVVIAGAIERIAPLPVLEELLAEHALREHDVPAAAAHAARLPAGARRDDLLARIAVLQRRDADAVRLFLQAGDERALAPFVARLAHSGRVRDAYALELRVRDRLAATETRPNALADSWWKLGNFATALDDPAAAAADYRHAIALAPLNTKYLLDAGVLELARRDRPGAAALFARAHDADPADARAVRLLRAGAPAAGSASTLTVAQQREPPSLNPALDNGTSSTEWGELLFQYLVKYDDRGRLVGDAAREVPTLANGGISRDGLTITYHLRGGLRFADGTPLTARDCAYSVDAINDPRNAPQSRFGYDVVQRAEARDATTLVLHLRRPFAPLIVVVLAPQGFPILPAHLLAHLHDFNRIPFDAMPVGSGPFVVTSWLHGDRVEMRANPYYFRGRPALDRLTVRFVPDPSTALNLLRTGEVDGYFSDLDYGNYPLLRAIAGVRVTRAPTNAVGALIFNTRDPVTGDARVRAALAAAIDIPAVVTKTYRGAIDPHDAGRGLFIWAYDRRAYPDLRYDPARARALLDAAGWRAGPDGVRRKDGRPLEVLLIIQAATPGDAIIGNTIAQYEKAVGVTVNLKAYNVTQFVAPAAQGGPVYGGAFQMALYPFVNGDDPDTTDQFSCATVPPNGYNKSRFCDRRVDALLAEGQRTYDAARRRAVYGRLQAILRAQLPIALLYQRPEVDTFRDDVRGATPSLSTVWWNVGAWRRASRSP